MHPWLMYQISVYGSTFDTYTPYWSALDFGKIKFEKPSWTNLTFSLFRTWILQATQAVKIKFEIDKKSRLSNLIFQKSSTDP